MAREHMNRCHAEDRDDEDGPHKCDRRYGHAGDHNCQCAYAWPQRPIIGSHQEMT